MADFNNETLLRDIGAVFMMGFGGTTVTPGIKQLIEDYHLGTIMLSGKNFKSAKHATQLILELQTIAHKAGHPRPLLIAIDQENGGLNNLCDPVHIRQFPGSMGLAATGSTTLCHEVAQATAREVSSVGVNWVLGPVLDVLNISSRNQPLGVRTMGNDPQEVSQMGVAFMQGLKDGGVATCGKHFPSYGNLEFLGSPLDVPVVSETVEQLQLNGLVPFRKAISANIDAIMVGGCAMSSMGTRVMHACLSEVVVDKLLRQDLAFDGVVVSECLEMEALHENIGVGQATVMALCAGCDVIIICRSFSFQLEALNGLKTAVESGIISTESVAAAAARVYKMKDNTMTGGWAQALNPPGIDYLTLLEPAHKELSMRAYQASITIVRDQAQMVPLSNSLGPDDEVLLLSPLVKPLPASLLAQAEVAAANARETKRESSPSGAATSADNAKSAPSYLQEKERAVMTGEAVFRELGRSLARENGARVLHTSYTANGIRPVHENLIERASVIIIITADANRNRYQYGFTKHVNMICSSMGSEGGIKPVIVISVSSPYDFAMDRSIGTYLVTYDFTESAIDALVKVLYGKEQARGALPGTIFKNQKQQQPRQLWLVEDWNKNRDLLSLQELLNKVLTKTTIEDPSAFNDLFALPATSYLTNGEDGASSPYTQRNFVVRNSSTRALYGFCSTYFNGRTGSIGLLLVDPTRRNISIGHSLHNRAIRYLLQQPGIKKLSLGTRLPGFFLGVPVENQVPNINALVAPSSPAGGKRLKDWFRNVGWTPSTTPVFRLVLPNLYSWTAPPLLSKSLSDIGTTFELITSPGTPTGTHNPLIDDLLVFVAQTDEHDGKLSDAYKMAVEDLGTVSTRILVALNASRQILGSIILFWPTLRGQGRIETSLPWILLPGMTGGKTGGMAFLVVKASAHRRVVFEGLVALAVRHFQMSQQQQQPGTDFERCVLNCVEGLKDMDTIVSQGGWEVWHSFEEIECDASDWKMISPAS